MPVPTFIVAKVPVPINVTASGDITPANEPVMLATVVASYTLLVAAALLIVSVLTVMSAVNPVG